MKTSKQQKNLKLQVKNDVKNNISDKKNLKIKIPKDTKMKFDNYFINDTPKLKHKEIEIIL